MIGGGSWMVVQGSLTLGQLTSFMMYLGLMIWPMLALAWMFRSRTVASNVAAAVVGKVVVAVNSNHAVGKVAQNLQARNLQKNRLAASAMPNRQANNNVAAVRVNLPLRSNLSG